MIHDTSNAIDIKRVMKKKLLNAISLGIKERLQSLENAVDILPQKTLK